MEVKTHRFEETVDSMLGHCKGLGNMPEGSSNKPSDNCPHTIEQAVELATKGWAYGLSLLKESRAEIEKIQGESSEQNFHYDVSGAYPDVARFLQGEPECMVDFSEQVNEKLISVGVNLSMSSGVNPARARNRGAAILAIISRLQDAGYKVRVNGYFISSDYHLADTETSVVKILLKDFNMVTDEDRLCFWMCNEAALRRIEFRRRENQSKEYIRTFGVGFTYGCRSRRETEIANQEGEDLYFWSATNANAWKTAESSRIEMERIIAQINEGKRNIRIYDTNEQKEAAV